MTSFVSGDVRAHRAADEARLDWLEVRQGEAPLLVSLPHTGTHLPPELESSLVSPWLARKDADWWVDHLYTFAADLGATTVRTALSRTAIDVNRDPSGVSLYPGQATTELCPITTFDGQLLYRRDAELTSDEVAARRARWFDPYHATLDAEVARLKARHGCVVVYDCHSIRSVIPRLFDGRLPVFNVGTNGGASCAPDLQDAVEGVCRATGAEHGRQRTLPRRLHHATPRTAGRWHPRSPDGTRLHGYMREPEIDVEEGDWPTSYDPAYAAPVRGALDRVLRACLGFAAIAG